MTTRQGSKPLSSRTVETMKPDDKHLSDTGEYRGLRVRCGQTGVKTFFYRYNSPVTGKLTQIKIGHFPETTLADARKQLEDLRRLRRNGQCPAMLKKEADKEAKIASMNAANMTEFTVDDLIELYLTQYIEDIKAPNGKLILGARKKKGQAEARRTLCRDAIERLGDLPADKVTRKDVVELTMHIVERGANVQAGNVLRELSSAYEFAIGMSKFSDEFANPAVLAKASLRQARVKLTSQQGKRVFSDSELVAFLRWLPSSGFTQAQKNILRFTLWTGCRTGEVCNASWRDFDLDKGVFHIRESKTGVERHVQMPTQAVAFLEELKKGEGGYPFAAGRTKRPMLQKKISEQAWRLRRDGKMLDIGHWSAHDLRRTVRTGLSRLQCPSAVAEAVLGHSRRGIEGTYDLHSYDSECREWLQRWSDHMGDLVKNNALLTKS